MPADPRVAYVPSLTGNEVQVGTANGPGLYVAPVGTAPPADTVAAWPSPWQILGYISDDGPTVAQNTSKQDIVPWQSRSPIRSVVTERGVTMHMILWQLNPITLAMYFDADQPVPAADGSLTFDVRSDQPQHLYAVGIDAKDLRGMRITFPKASLTDAGDMKIQKGAAVPLEVTLSALDTAGVLAHVLLGPTPTGSLLETGEVVASGGKAA